jgi:antibiotic biosynthesis monooxygenase (ABM) superfamily enzyme
MSTSVPRLQPCKLRLSAVMLAVIYPFVTAVLYILMPLTEEWSLWQRTLLLAPVMVFSIVYVIAPNVHKHFGWFILRAPRSAAG